MCTHRRVAECMSHANPMARADDKHAGGGVAQPRGFRNKLGTSTLITFASGARCAPVKFRIQTRLFRTTPPRPAKPHPQPIAAHYPPIHQPTRPFAGALITLRNALVLHYVSRPLPAAVYYYIITVHPQWLGCGFLGD